MGNKAVDGGRINDNDPIWGGGRDVLPGSLISAAQSFVDPEDAIAQTDAAAVWTIRDESNRKRTTWAVVSSADGDVELHPIGAPTSTTWRVITLKAGVPFAIKADKLRTTNTGITLTNISFIV